jgi:hypothetical protein
MRWPGRQPRSLRRLARKRQAKAEGLTRGDRAWRRLRSWGWNVRHHRLWSLCLVVPAFLIAFIPWSVSLWPLRGLKEAPDLLEVLWQVQAAALALSLAVVIFIFEAVYSARPRPSIRDLAEGVGLPAIFYSGLTGLGLTGMVLLGGGRGAPGGWAATWALTWAALSGVGLIALFVVMLRDIEPDALYGRWLAKLRAQVEQAIEDEIFERIAANLLSDVCQRAALDFQPVFGAFAPSQLEVVPAPRAGVIHDVNLWRVAKAGRLSTEFEVARAHGGEQPAVLVHVGAGIGAGRPLMRVARVISRMVPLSRAFKIVDRDPEAALNLALSQIHDEAVRLIRDGSPGAYARIADVYERLLLAQPETWARYGQRFGPDAAGGLHPFQFTLFDRVERRLYEELELAVMSPSREIGREALNLPVAVAFGTIEPRAIALARRMLRLFVAIQQVLVRSPASDKRSALLGNSWLRLSEYGRSVERLVTDDESSADDRDYGAQALRQVFDAYTLMGKAFIDHNPRESGAFSELNRYLGEFLQHWDPEHDDPQNWQVELLAQRVDADPIELARLRARVEEKAARVKVKDDLETWRAAQRFSLLWWSLRRLRDSGDSGFVDAWNAFVGYFGDIEETAHVVDSAIEADFSDRGPWSDWVLSGLAMGQAHALAVDWEFLQTFIVLAINNVPPDGPAPQVDPLEWLATRTHDIRGTVDGVIANENLRPLLPEERLQDRADRVVEAIEAMLRAREQQEEQRMIDSTLDPDAVAEFREDVRRAWAARRLVGPALIDAGMYEVPGGDPPEGTRWGIVPELIVKGLFIPEPRVLGGDWRATDIGRGLAESEMRRLAERAFESTEYSGDEETSLAEDLRGAIADVRPHGEKLIVLVPSRWRLIQSLELTLAERRGGGARPPRWVPQEEAHESFVGTADDIPVFEAREMPADKIAVIAVDSFVRWRQWKLQDDHEIHISITDYDDQGARALVEEDGALYLTEERTTVEARAREVRKAVLLDVYERFEVEIVEPEAARWLTVPDDLRGH